MTSETDPKGYDAEVVAELRVLISEYWDEAYAEGQERRSTDTPDSKAASTLAAIETRLSSLTALAAERDALILDNARYVQANTALLAKVERMEKAARVATLIDELRRDEGDSVTILCDNPDWNGQPNNAIIVNAGWTEWQDFRVSGHTLEGALQNALAIRSLAPADRAARSALNLETKE